MDRRGFPSYQYRDCDMLWHSSQTPRVASVSERERAMGYPIGYTANCLPKGEVKSNTKHHEDVRMSLVGNAWNVAVIAFLLMQLLAPLELCMVCALDGLIATLYRDLPVHGDCLLAWHSLGRTFRSDSPVAEQLAQKLMTLMSAKGEDVMLQVSGEVRVQQRCRKSIQRACGLA